MKASVLRTADILSRRLSNVYLYSLEEFSRNSMWTWLYLGEAAPPITPGGSWSFVACQFLHLLTLTFLLAIDSQELLMLTT